MLKTSFLPIDGFSFPDFGFRNCLISMVKRLCLLTHLSSSRQTPGRSCRSNRLRAGRPSPRAMCDLCVVLPTLRVHSRIGLSPRRCEACAALDPIHRASAVLHSRALWGRSDRRTASPRSVCRNGALPVSSPGETHPTRPVEWGPRIIAIPRGARNCLRRRPSRYFGPIATPHACAGGDPAGCGPIVPGLFDCHRGRNGATRSSEKE